jgi:glycosyltransferase involved in cell wall biosynthesis
MRRYSAVEVSCLYKSKNEMGASDKTLVIITPGFPGDELDSTCLPSQQLLVRTLTVDYPDVRIIVLTLEYPFRKFKYTWHGVEVIPFGTRRGGRLRTLFLLARVWMKLRQLERRYRIMGIFSFWVSECALVGKYFAKSHGLRHYSWILGQDARKGNPYVKFIRPRPSELVAMSGFLANEFYRNYGITPLHMIPNGVEDAHNEYTDEARNLDLIGVGSLIPLKQHDLFVEVVDALKKQLPDLKAMICGKGPELENLRLKIRAAGLQETLKLAGEQSHDEVIRLMRRAKILLHTSSYEGFSTVCLEALSAGAQVISFCNPMVGWINHWKVVGTREEMIRAALAILQDNSTEFRPVVPFRMSTSVRQLMTLFGCT